jgi:hypothetical protein
MQAEAVKFAGQAGKFHCCFREKSFNSLFPFNCFKKGALTLTRSVCLRAF